MSDGRLISIDASGNQNYVGDNNALPTKIMNRNLQQSFTILNGTNISTSYIDLGGKVLVALNIPSGYTAGNITFQSCDTANGTYQDVYDANGNLVTLNVSSGGRIVCLTGTALQAIASLQYIKIKTASNVTADRTIVAIAKG